MSNLYSVLYVFVEGLDDERFFAHYFSVRNINIKIIKYRNMNRRELSNLLRSFKRNGRNKYVFVVDGDHVSIEERIEKALKKYPDCSRERLIVSQEEIESWYLAGLNHEQSDRLKVKYIKNTDDLTKEKFESMVPSRLDCIRFKIEILKVFDIDEAKNRNHSFCAFAEMY